MAEDQSQAVGAIVAETSLRRVDVLGDDRQRYLEDVTTQRIVDAPIGAVLGALHLDPHGAPLAMFDVVVLGDRLVVLTPDDEVASWVVDTLGSRTFLLDARFEATEDRAIAVRGETATKMLADAGLGHVEGRCRLADDVLIVHRDGGADLIGPAEVVTAIREDLIARGAHAGDADALEQWRIEAGQPAWRTEVRHPHLPEEAGVLPTHVHLAKGCYPGQEAVARMWILGRPRRRLVQLATDIEEPRHDTPAEEAATMPAVEVTSTSPDRRLALAYAPRDVAPGDVVEGGGTRWQVLDVVGDEIPPGHDPKVSRRRDQRAR